MPWRTRVSRGAGLPTVFLALSMGVVVSCVSITASAPAGGGSDLGSARPLAAALASVSPSPAVVPTQRSPQPATPVPTAAPTPEPTAALTPEPTPAPTPEPTPAVPAAATPEVSSEMLAETALATASVATAIGTIDEKTEKKLQAVLRNTVKNKNVAGLQAAVRLPSGETWLGTAGKAEFEPDRRLEDDTAMAIASITKTFTAALILQLVDEGKIDLDEPFGTYFADAPRSKTVTVRQLLSHTSGIYNYFANPRYGKAASAWLASAPTGLNSREHRWTYDEIMSLVKSGTCKPGKCYQYSNTNFVILGQLAEAVEGEPLHRQLRQRFFDPLDMKDTVYQPAERPAADAAHGHWWWGAGWSDHTRGSRYVPFMAAASVADAAGAIASTAKDLSIWADALYGGDVLSAESLAQMTTFAQSGTYGLGTDVAVFAGHRGHGHRGGLRGFESSMWYFPQEDVSVVVLSNQGNWITDEPMGKLVRAALGKG